MPPSLRPRLPSSWQSLRIVPRRTIHSTPRPLYQIRYIDHSSNSDAKPEHFPHRFLYPPAIKQKSQNDVLSIRDFTILVEKGEAGVPEAIAILEASRTRLERLPLEEQRDKAAAAGASQILRWLLGTDPKNWDLTITRELAEPLCWHLEAEGRSDTVQTWLEIWANDESLRKDAVKVPLFNSAQKWNGGPFVRFQWPATVLACMARAKIWWFPKNPDPALTFVISVYDAARRHVFIRYLNKPLVSAVTADEALPCNQYLYSRLKQMAQDMHRAPMALATFRARLLLAHPVNPDPRYTLQFFQNEQYTTAALCWSYSAKLSFSNHALKAAYVCYLRGERDNATFLKSWSVKLHSRPFGECSTRCKPWQKDPKLKGLHESAATKGLDYMNFAKDMAD